jgi:hypothetical protein
MPNARQRWADYCRMRRRPTKTCPECEKSFPNDRAHFASTAGGRLLSRCHHCTELNKRKQAMVGGAGPTQSICPLCEAAGRLVIDRQAPKPVRVCRACLVRINSFRAPALVSAALLLQRTADYVRWQQSM